MTARRNGPEWEWAFPCLVLVSVLYLLLVVLPTRKASGQPSDQIHVDGFESGDLCAWGGDCEPPDPPSSFARAIRTVERSCAGPGRVRVLTEFCETPEPMPRADVVGYDALSREQFCVNPEWSVIREWIGPARPADRCGR